MKKKIWITAVLAATVLSTILILSRSGSTNENQYQFVEVTRGNLENIISCTGTLSAVGTIEIGTQVSGTIDKVLADFNDVVSKGQILAVLDTAVLKATVRDADASVMRAEADLEQATSDQERYQRLFDQGLISDADLLVSSTTLKKARASLQAAQATYDRARVNLEYAVIRSPIDGTVIDRDVEQGQTVAASLSTPTLFIIAEDLASMEIHAQVDESDIGSIKEGQAVRFAVQAHIDDTFEGVARQIRLQPTTVSNVVNYTVVVDAANRNGLLLPGMTATVDFIVEQRENVVLIPNTALRFSPTVEMMVEMRESMPDLIKQRMRNQFAEGETATGRTGPPGMQLSEDMARVWYLDEAGMLRMSPIRTGATDGKMTEIVESRDLSVGSQLISSVTSGSSSEQQVSSSAFEPGRGPGFGRGF